MEIGPFRQRCASALLQKDMEQRMIAVAIGAPQRQEQAAALDPLQERRRFTPAEDRIAGGWLQLNKNRRAQQKGLNLFGLAGEHFLGQVGEERLARER